MPNLILVSHFYRIPLKILIISSTSIVNSLSANIFKHVYSNTMNILLGIVFIFFFPALLLLLPTQILLFQLALEHTGSLHLSKAEERGNFNPSLKPYDALTL